MNLSIKEAFQWRETQGHRLTAPPFYGSPPPTSFPPLCCNWHQFPSPLAGRALFCLLSQRLPERNYFPLVGCEAKHYLSCSRLLWDNIWFEGIFSLL